MGLKTDKEVSGDPKDRVSITGNKKRFTNT